MQVESLYKKGERSLHDTVADIIGNCIGDFGEYEKEAKGQVLSSIHKSINNRGRQAKSQLKTEFEFPINDVINKRKSLEFLLTLTEDERVKQELARTSVEKTKKLAQINKEAKEKIIPLRNESIQLGKEASKLERDAGRIDSTTKELRKKVKKHPAHNNKIYIGGQLLLGFGDALALYMTLQEAGAGDNKTIIFFLPLFAFIMAGLAHFWGEAILEKNRVRKWIFGSISTLILVTLVLTRLLHFNL